MDPATASVFENFRILNDGIKAMLVAMPPVTLLAFTALFLNHRRKAPTGSSKAGESMKKAPPPGSEIQPDCTPISLPALRQERHDGMRNILEEIRVRNFVDKKLE